MQLNSISDFEQLEKGARIQVSDNTPEPPMRHKRKLANWKLSNYTGYFWSAGRCAGRHFF